MNKLVPALALAACALTQHASSEASLKFKNKTCVDVFVAAAIKDKYNDIFHDYTGCGYGTWRTAGWWKVAPGGTKTSFTGDMDDFSKRFFAEGGNLVWDGGGSNIMCGPTEAFDRCGTCQTGMRTPSYRSISTNADTVTVNLTSSLSVCEGSPCVCKIQVP